MLVKLPEQIAGFVCYIKNKKNRRTIMKQAASNKIANSPLHLIQKYSRKHREPSFKTKLISEKKTARN